ncbi:hypothetical protein J2W22_003047 [Sphingomonas kyeonggiensis]|uniref:hypothetical protein n=1 Tax=Sphingomonas kyeonggiensis TaxID=1268553 RepID=UPI002786016F|nr:hypothetical protein [Sphingomonas kyeonggiensis]MDQ0250983.1 hypothetical protein [Sphingomonas kyeonggiensis]
MHYIRNEISEQERELRNRITHAVVDTVIETCGGENADKAILDIALVIDGVATAIGWMASNVPEYRTPRGSRQIGEDVRDVVKGILRSVASSHDEGAATRFAWPVDSVGGRA